MLVQYMHSSQFLPAVRSSQLSVRWYAVGQRRNAGRQRRQLSDGGDRGGGGKEERSTEVVMEATGAEEVKVAAMVAAKEKAAVAEETVSGTCSARARVRFYWLLVASCSDYRLGCS